MKSCEAPLHGPERRARCATDNRSDSDGSGPVYPHIVGPMLARGLAGVAAGERHISAQNTFLRGEKRPGQDGTSMIWPWPLVSVHHGALFLADRALTACMQCGILEKAGLPRSMPLFGKGALTDLQRYFRPCHSQCLIGSNMQVDEISLS